MENNDFFMKTMIQLDKLAASAFIIFCTHCCRSHFHSDQSHHHGGLWWA